ncbi:diguanylate cyclase [Aestuariibacter salexigens]|uniref:diguanylate cyclase n=1 Tax=Aestuariibacter salexigens TaxID=226010 RepID=UPI000410451E|nr:diguanylate cyclase [Aestuariibacter salexigens]
MNQQPSGLHKHPVSPGDNRHTVRYFDEFREIEQGNLGNAKILLVDDELINLELLQHQLSAHYKLSTAKSGMEAVEYCIYNLPDLVLMDVNMPQINGMEACEMLKSNQLTRHIPVLFLTSMDSVEDEIRCLDIGGSDFITKPANIKTLINRINIHLTLKLKADLLHNLVFKDSLTGVYSQRYLQEFLYDAFDAAMRVEQPLSLLVIDIDHFDAINVNYGHDAGDHCLCKLAQVIDGCLKRPTDLVARTGGDRFVCVLKTTDAAGAIQLSNHVIEQVQGASQRLPIGDELLSVSIGISSTSKDKSITSANEMMQVAEHKLQQAKQAGRHCYAV